MPLTEILQANYYSRILLIACELKYKYFCRTNIFLYIYNNVDRPYNIKKA